MTEFAIHGDNLSIAVISEILKNKPRVVLTESAKQTINRGRRTIEDIVSSGRVVYGVNTGFGKFSDVRISDDQLEILQENLVRSHACGVGEPFPADIAKVMLLLKANGLAKGYSGVRLEIVETLLAMFNADVLPVIPQQGSVGSSGDLAPLAHLTLVLMGEGEAWFQGQRLPGGEAMKRAGIKPVRLRSKEGL
ncbi:MAG TPA: aromatic amino acid lyase, partial [bacterium]|nr:aromatic amino acid lyase [bacterium]